MNTFCRNIILTLLIMSMASCATGKNAFEKGNYETALNRAVKRLKSNPNNKKARDVLVEGYNYASQYHLTKIKEYGKSSDSFKWERIYSEYSLLNRYYRDIISCPACIDAVSPISYVDEQENAAFQAAEVQLALGREELAFNTIETGRQAYGHFESALRFNNNIPGIDSLLNAALEMGTVRVLVEPIPVHSRNLELTNDYFANRMFEYFDQFSQGRFVRFITGDEAIDYQIQPDHIITMEFDDFVLGQQLVEKETIKLERDSVKVGTFKDDEGIVHDVFGTVKADLIVYNKTLASQGVLNFEVRDAYSNRVLINRKFASEDIWTYQWANFNGDERALERDELRLTRKEEIPPPNAQQLFGSFIDRIYDQAISQVKQLYRGSGI